MNTHCSQKAQRNQIQYSKWRVHTNKPKTIGNNNNNKKRKRKTTKIVRLLWLMGKSNKQIRKHRLSNYFGWSWASAKIVWKPWFVLLMYCFSRSAKVVWQSLLLCCFSRVCFVFWYGPFIWSFGSDSLEPRAWVEWWANQLQVQRDSQLAAGSSSSSIHIYIYICYYMCCVICIVLTLYIYIYMYIYIYIYVLLLMTCCV